MDWQALLPEALVTFHFAQPEWFILLLLTILLTFWRLPTGQRTAQRLQQYAQPQLLPFLLAPWMEPRRWRNYPLRWWLLWLLLVLALAGPRWDQVEVPVWQNHANLVVLLDISSSMDLRDPQLTRLAQAKAEIDTLLAYSQGLRAGLVAFASVALPLTPLSEDTQALRAQLEALDGEMLRWRGSRVGLALTRAERLFLGQSPGSSRHIWLLSDGDFENLEHLDQARALAAQGIHLHVTGVGTARGVPLPLADRQGQAIWSRLDADGLQALAVAGGGSYTEADGSGRAALSLRNQLARATTAQLRAGSQWAWHERFYFLLAPALLLLLPSWRRVMYRAGGPRA